MRVLLVSPTLERAGAERIVVDLARHLHGQGHEVVVAAPAGPLGDELAADGVGRHPLADRGRSSIGAARAVLAVAGAVRVLRPTVVHAHNPKMTAVARAALALGVRRRPPLLATFHGGDPRDDLAAARLLRRADEVVCVEDDLRTRLVAHRCPLARTRVVLNGVAVPVDDEPALRNLDAELGLDPAAPVVVTVGSLVEAKAVDRVVRAARLVVESVPQAEILIVGDGPLRGELEALAATVVGPGRVRFLGARPDVPVLLQRASVAVSTSRREGLSLAALETLAAGTPLVAPDVGGMRRLLRSGAGVLVDDTEPATVAAALVAVLRAPDEGRAMGEVGRELVTARHGRGRMLTDYEALYGELSRGAS
ncbi:MAG TPA: glycosyltransferase [Iamia sp.]|nr:glycosyltransferase [Iamia sp.]